MRTLPGRLATLGTGVATALALLGLAILLFLNPVWVGFAQDRAEAAAWTGLSRPELRTLTDGILADLVLGPPAFDVSLDGSTPALNERERGHMRDVRSAFTAFYAAVAVALALLVGSFVLARGTEARARWWHRLAAAGRAIAVITVALGVVALVAFDAAFDLFHALFFPPGTYLFDPRTERLVQLFPQRFWVETTIAVGAVALVLALALAWVARRRAAALDALPRFARPVPRPAGVR